ncbi:MAG: hypothetical protein AAFP90_10200, partial [Planctomycetota bacterium]
MPDSTEMVVNAVATESSELPSEDWFSEPSPLSELEFCEAAEPSPPMPSPSAGAPPLPEISVIDV